MLYRRYLGMLLKSQLQYKASFIMTTIGQFLVSFTTFLGIYFLFSRFQQVDGYTFPQILLCFSTVLMSYSFTECFARGFDVFPRLIRTGELDRILVRPRSVVFQVLTSTMDFSLRTFLASGIGDGVRHPCQWRGMDRRQNHYADDDVSGRLRRFFRAVCSVCGHQLFYHRWSGVYEYFHRWQS